MSEGDGLTAEFRYAFRTSASAAYGGVAGGEVPMYAGLPSHATAHRPVSAAMSGWFMIKDKPLPAPPTRITESKLAITIGGAVPPDAPASLTLPDGGVVHTHTSSACVGITGEGRSPYGAFKWAGAYHPATGTAWARKVYMAKPLAPAPGVIKSPSAPKTPGSSATPKSRAALPDPMSLALLEAPREKRPVKVPKTFLAEASAALAGGKADPETRACNEIMTALRRESNNAAFFLRPVDPVADQALNYFDVIAKPMDLGTVQSKLDKREYASAEDFASDVRLVFDNAIRYNGELHMVGQAAASLRKVFEARWTAWKQRRAAQEAAAQEAAAAAAAAAASAPAGSAAIAGVNGGPKRPRKRDRRSDGDDSSLDDDDQTGSDSGAARTKKPRRPAAAPAAAAAPADAATASTVAKTLEALANVQQVLSALSAKGQLGMGVANVQAGLDPLLMATVLTAVMQNQGGAAPVAAAPVAAPPSSTAPAKKRAPRPRPRKSTPGFPETTPPAAAIVLQPRAVLVDVPLTIEEKRALGDDVNMLQPHQVEEVFRIVQEREGVSDAAGDELELDMDTMQTGTLRELQRYIAMCLGRPVPGLPLPVPAPAPAPAAETSPAAAQSAANAAVSKQAAQAAAIAERNRAIIAEANRPAAAATSGDVTDEEDIPPPPPPL